MAKVLVWNRRQNYFKCSYYCPRETSRNWLSNNFSLTILAEKTHIQVCSFRTGIMMQKIRKMFEQATHPHRYHTHEKRKCSHKIDEIGRGKWDIQNNWSNVPIRTPPHTCFTNIWVRFRNSIFRQFPTLFFRCNSNCMKLRNLVYYIGYSGRHWNLNIQIHFSWIPTYSHKENMAFVAFTSSYSVELYFTFIKTDRSCFVCMKWTSWDSDGRNVSIQISMESTVSYDANVDIMKKMNPPRERSELEFCIATEILIKRTGEIQLDILKNMVIQNLIVHLWMIFIWYFFPFNKYMTTIFQQKKENCKPNKICLSVCQIFSNELYVPSILCNRNTKIRKLKKAKNLKEKTRRKP